jgi:cardiolipin synthase
LILGLLSIWLSATKRPLIEVTYLGKAATFNLMYAFPFLLLALADSWLGTAAFVLGWAFAFWGTALYLVTGFSYFVNAIGRNKVRA